MLASTDPLPLAMHAAQCPYREAMVETFKQDGRKTRVVLESPSNQAVKACVEAGLAISLIDRSGVTDAMQILSDLPEIAEHEIVFASACVTDRRGGEFAGAGDAEAFSGLVTEPVLLQLCLRFTTPTPQPSLNKKLYAFSAGTPPRWA